MKRIGTAILSAALVVASLPAAAMTTQENEVLDLINHERARHGCGALTINARLTAAAEGHATAMARKNFFGHKGPNGSTLRSRTNSAGYRGGALAENIAAGWSTPEKTVEQWMASSGHRKNILTCKYRETGIAMVYQPDDAPIPGQLPYPMKYYWVQVFGKK
jgi:uncharacterized protein YkwD